MFRSFFALLVVCCTTVMSAEGYSFSIKDSSIVIGDRNFSYYVDEYQGQTLFRTYLPGKISESEKMLIVVQYMNQEITILAKAVAEKNNLVTSTKIFFSLDNLYKNYERLAYPGIIPDDVTKEEVDDLLKNSNNWRMISLQ